MSQLIPITAQQAQSYQVGSSMVGAAEKQPGASLQSTQLGNQVAGQNVQQQDVNTQQIQAPQALGADLKNGMTLSDAMKKYLPLKVDPHDIYKQYLAGNTYGPNGTPKAPVESPEQLINMGVPADALGKVGETGTVQDRWNTGSVVEEFRKANDLWNQTSAANLAGNKAGYNAASEKYLTARAILGEHISTAIGGAPSGETTAATLMNLLPNSTNLLNYSPDVAKGKFDTAEEMLRLQKRYSYDDIYTKPPTDTAQTQQKPTTGGGLLTNLLGMVANPVAGLAKSMLVDPVVNATNKTTAENAGMPNAKGNLIQSVLNAGKETANFAKNTVGNPEIWGEAATLEGGIDGVGALKAAPATLAKILGKGAAKEVAGSVPEVAAALKGNPIMDLINPKGIVSRGGAVRDALVDTSTKAGITKNPSAIIADLEKSVPRLKMGNLGQGDIIDRSIADAKNAFKGPLSAQDLANAYKEADSGFTKAGAAKTAIQSNIDRNLRDILSKHLDQMAPGWNDATTAMAKGFQAQKSAIRPFVKRAGAVGLGVLGLDSLRHMIGI